MSEKNAFQVRINFELEKQVAEFLNKKELVWIIRLKILFVLNFVVRVLNQNVNPPLE